MSDIASQKIFRLDKFILPGFVAALALSLQNLFEERGTRLGRAAASLSQYLGARSPPVCSRI